MGMATELSNPRQTCHTAILLTQLEAFHELSSALHSGQP